MQEAQGLRFCDKKLSQPRPIEGALHFVHFFIFLLFIILDCYRCLEFANTFSLNLPIINYPFSSKNII